MNLIFPSKHDCVVTAPLNVSRRSFRLGLILANLVLKIAGNDPHHAIFGVKCDVESIRRDADVFKWSIRKNTVFCFRGVDYVDGLANSKQHLNTSGEGIGWWYDCPRVYFIFGWYGKKLGSWFDVMCYSDQMVVGQDSYKSRGPEATGLDFMFLGTLPLR